MITFRGDMSPPEFEHGDKVVAAGLRGVIQHRRHNGRAWEYGVLLDGIAGVQWYQFLSIKKE